MDKEHITLIPVKVNNVIQWTMIHDGKIGQGGNYPDVDLPDPTDYKITFTIADINQLGIKFDSTVIDANSKPKALNAIWISEGSGVQKQSGAYPEQIDHVGLQEKGTQLVVTDKNSDAVTLTYKLNFVGPTNLGAITPIDPEIRNGGGNGNVFFDMDTVTLLLGLAVLALTSLLWVTHLRSRRSNVGNPQTEGQRSKG